MTCPRSEAIDRLVGGSRDEALEAHVAGCPACSEERGRAEREAREWTQALKPMRMRGDLRLNVAAPASRRSPGWFQAWSPAAAILLVTVIGFLATASPPVDPAAPGQDAVRLISVELVRRDEAGHESGSVQNVLAEELPFLQKEFASVEFLDRVILETGDWPARNYPSIEVKVKREKRGELESWTVNAGASGHLTYTKHPGTATSAQMQKQQFGKLWSILDRAMNPLQIYVDPGKEKDQFAALVAYRGGVPAWDLKTAPPRLKTVCIARGGTDHKTDELLGGYWTRPPDPDKPFAIGIVADFGIWRRSGVVPTRWTFRWSSGEHRSPEIEVQVDPKETAREDRLGRRVTSVELRRFDSDGNPIGSRQDLRPEEIPQVMGALEEAGLRRILWSTDERFTQLTGDYEELNLYWTEEGSDKKHHVELNRGTPKDPGVIIIDDERRPLIAFPERETFDRLWAILERAMNPLQLYEWRLAGGKRRCLLVYRGGLDPWEESEPPMILAPTGGGVVPYRQVPLDRLGVKAPSPPGPFVADVVLEGIDEAWPQTKWGWKGHEASGR